jgi:hypothetical protein
MGILFWTTPDLSKLFEFAPAVVASPMSHPRIVLFAVQSEEESRDDHTSVQWFKRANKLQQSVRTYVLLLLYVVTRTWWGERLVRTSAYTRALTVEGLVMSAAHGTTLKGLNPIYAMRTARTRGAMPLYGLLIGCRLFSPHSWAQSLKTNHREASLRMCASIYT